MRDDSVLLGELAEGFNYSRQVHPDDERGHRKARRLCAYDAIMTGRTPAEVAARLAKARTIFPRVPEDAAGYLREVELHPDPAPSLNRDGVVVR